MGPLLPQEPNKPSKNTRLYDSGSLFLTVLSVKLILNIQKHIFYIYTDSKIINDGPKILNIVGIIRFFNLHRMRLSESILYMNTAET